MRKNGSIKFYCGKFNEAMMMAEIFPSFWFVLGNFFQAMIQGCVMIFMSYWNVVSDVPSLIALLVLLDCFI
jgi:hypothetical protein